MDALPVLVRVAAAAASAASAIPAPTPTHTATQLGHAPNGSTAARLALEAEWTPDGDYDVQAEPSKQSSEEQVGEWKAVALDDGNVVKAKVLPATAAPETFAVVKVKRHEPNNADGSNIVVESNVHGEGANEKKIQMSKWKKPPTLPAAAGATPAAGTPTGDVGTTSDAMQSRVIKLSAKTWKDVGITLNDASDSLNPVTVATVYVVVAACLEVFFGSTYDGGARMLLIAAREHIHRTS
jgi:hypothetical protein